MIYTEKGQTLAINVYLVVMVLIIWEYVVTMAIIGKYTDIASMKAFGTSFSFCYKFSNAVMILHAPTFPSCLLNILIPLTFHFSVSTCWLGCALACFDCHFFTYIKLACIASPWRFSWSPFTNLRSPQSQVSGIPDQNASKGVFSRSPFCPPPLPADLPSFLPPFSTTFSIVKAISSAADSCSLRLLGFHGTITFPPPPSTWSISSLNPILPRRNHSKSLRNKIKKSFQLEKKKWITSNLHLDYVGSPSDHWKTIKRIRSKYQPRTQTVGTRVTVLLRSEKSTVLAHHLRDHVWPIPLPDPVEDPLSPQPDLESPFTMVDMFRSGREGAWRILWKVVAAPQCPPKYLGLSFFHPPPCHRLIGQGLCRSTCALPHSPPP